MADNVDSANILNFENKKKKKSKPPPIDDVVVPDDLKDVPEFGTKKKKTSEIKEEATSNPDQPAGDEDLLNELKTKKKKKSVVIDDQTVETISKQLDENLSFTSKKKKKKVKPLDVAAVIEDQTANETVADSLTKDSADASGFTYDVLLKRVFAQLGALNPELVSDQKRRLVMVPPQMARVGTKKTLFVNFSSICHSLNRDASHLSTYMLAELGTQGSVDANSALLIRGRYQSKHIEPVLRTYCRTYVLCGTCQSPETDLCKDSRLLFLHCRRCGSRITVKNVTSGFQAVTGKRAAIRARIQ